MRYFLGIDIGGSKSHALWQTKQAASGLRLGGRGQPRSRGLRRADRRAPKHDRRRIQMAGLRRDQIAGAGFGVGGYDWPSDARPPWMPLRPSNFSVRWKPSTTRSSGCWPAPNRGGALHSWAARATTVAAGIARGGKGAPGERHRIWRVWRRVRDRLQAVHEVARAWTRRGPATALCQAFVAVAGHTQPADLLEGLSQEQYHLARQPPWFSRWRKLAILVACGVLRWNAESWPAW